MKVPELSLAALYHTGQADSGYHSLLPSKWVPCVHTGTPLKQFLVMPLQGEKDEHTSLSVKAKHREHGSIQLGSESYDPIQGMQKHTQGNSHIKWGSTSQVWNFRTFTRSRSSSSKYKCATILESKS